jgi:hypothetical protein
MRFLVPLKPNAQAELLSLWCYNISSVDLEIPFCSPSSMELFRGVDVYTQFNISISIIPSLKNIHLFFCTYIQSESPITFPESYSSALILAFCLPSWFILPAFDFVLEAKTCCWRPILAFLGREKSGSESLAVCRLEQSR